MKTEYGYDEEGNIEKLETKQGEEIWLSLVYRYDGEGNRIERKGKQRGIEGEEEVETTYRYDSLYQLKEESYGEKKILYAYDKAGNRTERRSEEGEEKYEYNERNQLVKWKKGEEERYFTYDKEGSIIREERKEGVREYEYNAEKQLICIRREKGEEQRNYYDAEGQRTESERRGKRRRYLYYKGELFEEKGEKERSYVFGYGIEALEEEGKEYYYHKDERNSTTYLSNERREIENRYAYDGYGRSQRKDEGVENAIRYTGQRYEEELEGYCLGVREYREEYGRFLTEDAYEGDGTNLYAYCRNNPIKYYDPSGYRRKNNEKGHTTPKGEEGKTPFEGNPGTSPNAIRKVQDDILDNMENCGGHLLKRHVSKRDSDLLKRASKQGVPSTSFKDKRTATKAVKQNIKRNATEISEWLNNPKSKGFLLINFEHGYSIGKGVNIKNGGKRASKHVTNNLTKSQLFLVKDSSQLNGYRIITGYPIF